MSHGHTRHAAFSRSRNRKVLQHMLYLARERYRDPSIAITPMPEFMLTGSDVSVKREREEAVCDVGWKTTESRDSCKLCMVLVSGGFVQTGHDHNFVYIVIAGTKSPTLLIISYTSWILGKGAFRKDSYG